MDGITPLPAPNGTGRIARSLWLLKREQARATCSVEAVGDSPTALARFWE